jgi:hypothetical protein
VVGYITTAAVIIIVIIIIIIIIVIIVIIIIPLQSTGGNRHLQLLAISQDSDSNPQRNTEHSSP